MNKVCLNCGNKYTAVSNRQKFCGSRTKKEGCSFLIKKEGSKIYCRKNAERLRILNKEWVKANKDVISKKRIDRYRLKNPIKPKLIRSKEELLEMSRVRNTRYYYKNKEVILKRIVLNNNKRKEVDIGFNIKTKVRYALWRALKNKNKTDKYLDFIGCSIAELRTHIESMFKENMSWDNYGKNGWVIDHIEPFASIDLNNENDLKRICYYTNLQPLWEKENNFKGIKTI